MSNKKWRVSTDKRVLGYFRGPKPEQAMIKAMNRDKQYHPNDWHSFDKIYADRPFEHYKTTVIELQTKKMLAATGHTFRELNEYVDNLVDNIARMVCHTYV